MQFARLNDVTLHYQVIGSPQSRPTIVFVNSLGTDFRIWRDVVVRLVGEFAVVTYDKRGHGLSEVGRTPYSMELLAEDRAALLGHIGVHIENPQNLFERFFVRCVGGVAFLPEELGGAQEHAGAQLPAQDVSPLIHQHR